MFNYTFYDFYGQPLLNKMMNRSSILDRLLNRSPVNTMDFCEIFSCQPIDLRSNEKPTKTPFDKSRDCPPTLKEEVRNIISPNCFESKPEKLVKLEMQLNSKFKIQINTFNGWQVMDMPNKQYGPRSVSYTHLTLPTKA